ncbi:MAG TPA: CAP domain-containing protein [Bacillota bacterium]
MFKKIVLTTTLATALFFSGSIHHFVDASANDSSGNVTYETKAYYSVNGGNWIHLSTKDFNKILSKWFANGKTTNDPQQSKEKAKQEANKAQVEKKQNQQKTEHAQNSSATEKQMKNETESAKQNKQTPNDQQLHQFEQEVVKLTNDEREKHGLSPLKTDTELSKVARDKSKDMATNGYFSHNSPTYGSPFDMMKKYGITYHTAGENIAKGQRTPQEVVSAWMNSEGHRANILNGEFTHIGVGYVEQGNHWTQQFIGK